MKLTPVDINCDTGEGVGNEMELFPFITRCNIACGGHAGDENSILQVIEMAKGQKIKIGAHPSYPDKLNFGRKVLNISLQELEEALADQLLLFKKCAIKSKIKVTHVKPHGALYNEASKNSELAETVVKVSSKVFPNAALVAPFHSELAKARIKTGNVIYEAFADRNYNSDLSLVSRKEPNATINNPEEVLSHLLYILKNNAVRTINNASIPIKATTFCVHGDTLNARNILKFINQKLPEYGWFIRL